MPSAAAIPASATELARALESFLAEHPCAAILEDGRLLFDMRLSRYSIGSEHGRCLLHLWSAERNTVRTVTAIRPRKDSLQLETRRFGQSRPQNLVLIPDHEHRTLLARDSARQQFLHHLEQALVRELPQWKLEKLTNGMDLENSFGPAYARGLLVRGSAAWAVLGVPPDETQGTIDGALTLAILWLAHCRAHGDGRRLIEGLKLIVPHGTSEILRTRMAWLNPKLAKWELHELDKETGNLSAIDIAPSGNISVRLIHNFDPKAALDRCGAGVERLLALLPETLRASTEIRPRNTTETAFLLHGLEYASVQHETVSGSFRREDRITFGAGANETELNSDTEELFLDLVTRLGESRHPAGNFRNPLYRMQPERWLESMLRRHLDDVEPAIRSEYVYSQVPAFSAGDRGMLDLLSITRAGRLAVLEIKAGEDLHLPLQALDYWIRVRQLHSEGALQRHGYFPSCELSTQAPLLYLIVPALRVHPANETVLRHLSPEIPWEMICLDEHWRKKTRVLQRKRSGS